MTSAATAVARRNRWAISFADLLLLLLAFFVLLQASGSRRDVLLSQVSRQFAGQADGLEIRSHGSDRGHQRFDEWDLAAARLGAVARALRSDGIAQDRLLIRGLDQGDGATGQGQSIRIAPTPRNPN